MTVKELINKLLDCEMDSEVYISDNVEYVDEEHNKVDGSIYILQNVKEGWSVYLEFDNRNHFKRKEGKEHE